MTNPWNQLLTKTAEDKDWHEMEEGVQEQIQEFKEEYRPRFEQEFEENEFPRHPYKIMMEIRKERGLYGGSSHQEPKLLRALEMLKEEYEDKWGEMANA